MTDTPHPRPHSGGSYIRNPDGSLTRVAADAVPSSELAPERPSKATRKAPDDTPKEG